MKDYRASLEKLRKDAAECALIRDLATDPAKREMYDRLHKHLNRLAGEIEIALNTEQRVGRGVDSDLVQPPLPPG